MAAVPITISGVLCDKLGRTIQQVTLVGEASLTGLGVGGGPIVPPAGGGGPGDAHPEHPIYYPPGVWPGPGDPDFPGGGGKPPGIWGPNDPRPTPPIAFPPGWVGGVPPLPPNVTPPEAPPPGSPTTAVPGNWPVAPIVPPDYLIVSYPGIGPVVVAPPAEAQPKG